MTIMYALFVFEQASEYMSDKAGKHMMPRIRSISVVTAMGALLLLSGECGMQRKEYVVEIYASLHLM